MIEIKKREGNKKNGKEIKNRNKEK